MWEPGPWVPRVAGLRVVLPLNLDVNLIKKTVPVELPDSQLLSLFLRGRGIIFFKGILF